MIGVRGPFGTDWQVSRADGRDLLVVAGGIGLAPLRSVLLAQGSGAGGGVGVGRDDTERGAPAAGPGGLAVEQGTARGDQEALRGGDEVVAVLL